ncbi:tyrosine-protein kinase Etk/Wzc [Catalinimonas alkaloidigena]|uniref:GumC family protein n=1 Tax=Catalinimonas alkaloidigena TaxID=1075417 RepID=UPI0024068E44|nr:tyrosine-protein kinase family protein [Catalinimonas alkaloidigena]MDF9799721.1 tyrosine-protein kinase Etk/Wzc [Catalinimonas alkaloidigena]
MKEQENALWQLEEAEPIDVKAMIRKYVRYWYWFVIGVAGSLFLAFIYLRYTTPEYSISSTILIKEDEKGSSFSGEEVLSDLNIFQSSRNIDNEIEILRSRSLMERVLTELGLQTTYYVKGQVRDVEVYGKGTPVKAIISHLDSTAFEQSVIVRTKGNNFELEEVDEEGNINVFPYKLGQKVKRPYATFTLIGQPNMLEEKEIIIKFHDIGELADDYREKLVVNPVNNDASVLRISMIDAVPQKGVAILAKLIELYKIEAIDDKNIMATNTIEFIDERLGYLTNELADVEKDVERYKRRNELTNVTTDAELYLEQASEYNEKISELRIQIDVLRSIEKYLQDMDNEFELVPTSLSNEDPSLMELISKFNELQLERVKLLRNSQPNHPMVTSINEQLMNLRVNILENLKSIKNSKEITFQNLQASSGRFESRIRQVPLMERELLEINRQQSIKQELYLFLLTKREEAALSQASTIANSRIIDPPEADDEPISPKKHIVILAVIFASLGLPLVLINVKELLNNKVDEQKDVEKATAVPVLGEVMHSEEKGALVVTGDKHSAVAEMFRLVRANLHFATLGKENKVILVTSSRSGEGKTFFSINLGASLALSGKKVIILSFDLRKPRLMKDLRLKDTLGITNYLVSDDFSVVALTKAVAEVPGLYAMGSGPIPPNPAELMMGDKVKQLIEELKKDFDHIILDSSPVGQVADAFNLAPYIDSTLYIVRYNYAFKEQLSIVEDIYRNKKLNHPMVVMNDAKKKNATAYGYGYGYGSYHQNGKHRGKSKKAFVRL